MTYVEVRITCALEHPLATFVPMLIAGNKTAWVGDLDTLQSASWESWTLVSEIARGAESRPSLHVTHDSSRAHRDGDDWRFYCRRCRRPMRISDSALGAAVTSAATRGEYFVNVEDLC